MKTRVFLTSVAIIATLFVAPNIALAEDNKKVGDMEKVGDTGAGEQQSPAKTVASQKYVDDTKQAKIPATSDGTGGTPNYVYDATTNPTADGGIVTTTSNPGIVSQRGIANAPTRNNNGNLTNGDWIPNMSAVDNMITDITGPIQLGVNEINNRIINGMPFNQGSKYPYQFAGEEDITNVPAATTTVRKVTIPAIDGDDISDWTVIVVQPGVTANATSAPGTFTNNGLLLKINDAKFGTPIRYKGRGVTDATAPIVWNANYPSIFVYSEKAGKNGAWLFAGSGDDLPTHKVNGAPLSNASSYYYGTGTVDATGISVTIPSIASTANTLPETGQIIVVKVTGTLSNYTCNTTNWELALNDFTAAPVSYDTMPLSCDPLSDLAAKSVIWKKGAPSMFVFNGTHWAFLGHGYDTTYRQLDGTASGDWSGPAGTGTTAGVISPSVLKSSIHRVNLVDTVTPFSATNSAITENDTVIGAFGKAQGQINNRQTLIPATSDGTNNTPNYVYNQSTNSTADGSVVTTGATDGTISQRGIATAPVYVTENNVTTLDNANWIPTMGALMNAVSGATSGTINGASLSNEASYFYGTSSTAATAEIKDVSIPGIATPGTNDRTIIVVQPEHTSANTGLSGIKLRLNSDAAADAKPIYVNGAATGVQTQSLAWNENYPSTFVYDGTKWVFLGAGYNIDAVISSYKVNGVSVSKNGGYFYAQSNVAGNLCAKTALFQTTDFNWTLNKGQVAVIEPLHTSTCNDAHTLSLNSTTAAPIYYNGAAVSDATTGAKVWAEGIPSIFVYDGTNWVFAGNSIDNNTTYPSMSVSEGTTGTATTESSLTAANLKQIVQGTTLTGLSTSSTALLTEADSITTAIGKLEGQKQIKISATSNGTDNTPNYVYNATTNPTADGSIVTTGATDGAISQRGIATAPVYVTENNVTTLDNASWIPTMGAVMNAISPLAWTSAEDDAATGYGTTFDLTSTHTTGNWSYQTEDKLIDTTALANALRLKQNKIPATSDGTNNTPNYVYNATTNPTANGSVITTTGTAGTVSQRGIATEAIPDGTGGFTNGDWIPTVGAVMNAITSHVPTGTANTVANYDANGALGTGIATANAATYNATTGALENGTNIATIAAVDTRQKKKVCAGYEPAEAGQPAHDGTHPGDEDYCWLWVLPD